jgi:hypothetical protein
MGQARERMEHIPGWGISIVKSEFFALLHNDQEHHNSCLTFVVYYLKGHRILIRLLIGVSNVQPFASCPIAEVPEIADDLPVRVIGGRGVKSDLITDAGFPWGEREVGHRRLILLRTGLLHGKSPLGHTRGDVAVDGDRVRPGRGRLGDGEPELERFGDRLHRYRQHVQDLYLDPGPETHLIKLGITKPDPIQGDLQNFSLKPLIGGNLVDLTSQSSTAQEEHRAA